MDIYTLAPEVRSPEGITVDVRDLRDDAGPRPCGGGFTPEDPEWETVLSQIEALRFRRPPWNLALQFVPQNTVTARTTHEGDRHIWLYMGRRGARSVRIQFLLMNRCTPPPTPTGTSPSG